MSAWACEGATEASLPTRFKLTVRAVVTFNRPMRRIVFSFLFGLALVAACADITESPTLEGTADAGSSQDATNGDGTGGDTGDEDAATKTDSGNKDAAVADGAKDSSAADTGRDGGSADTGTDVSVPVDGGTDAQPGCAPPAGNFAFCGTASATNAYAGYGPERANDGDLDTSWFAASNTCPANVCPGVTIKVDVVLDTTRSVGRIKLFGNREFELSYDTLTAKIQMLNAAGSVVYTTDVATPRGAEPNGDVNHVVSPAPVSGVKTIRVIVLTGESPGPGFAEVEAYAN